MVGAHSPASEGTVNENDDIDVLVEHYLHDHCGTLLGTRYGSLLDEPGGLELLGAMILANERSSQR